MFLLDQAVGNCEIEANPNFIRTMVDGLKDLTRNIDRGYWEQKQYVIRNSNIPGYSLLRIPRCGIHDSGLFTSKKFWSDRKLLLKIEQFLVVNCKDFNPFPTSNFVRFLSPLSDTPLTCDPSISYLDPGLKTHRLFFSESDLSETRNIKFARSITLVNNQFVARGHILTVVPHFNTWKNAHSVTILNEQIHCTESMIYGAGLGNYLDYQLQM